VPPVLVAPVALPVVPPPLVDPAAPEVPEPIDPLEPELDDEAALVPPLPVAELEAPVCDDVPPIELPELVVPADDEHPARSQNPAAITLLSPQAQGVFGLMSEWISGTSFPEQRRDQLTS
jgi:hypothetical protein